MNCFEDEFGGRKEALRLRRETERRLGGDDLSERGRCSEL
jgi:hypothetical protein